MIHEPMNEQELRDALARFTSALSEKRQIAQLGKTDRLDSAILPTGFDELDRLLGGGLPRGQIAEICGHELAGKTRFALAMMARTQRAGGAVAFVDADEAWQAAVARTAGVKEDGLWYHVPQSAEQAFDVVEALVCSNAMDLIVVDSVAGLVSESECSGAKVSQWLPNLLRKLKQALANTRTCVVLTRCSHSEDEFLDQTWSLGADWHSLAHHAATRIRVADEAGAARCTVVKCRLAPVPQEAIVALPRTPCRDV